MGIITNNNLFYMNRFISKEIRELAKQTFSSQVTEFFLLYGQRLFGFVVFVAFTYLPLHFARIYSEEMNYMVKNHYNGFFLIYIQVKDVCTWGYIGFVYLIYTMEHPFFEQYKINTSAWPWKTDPVGYKKHEKKALLQCFINYTVIQYGGFFAFLYLGILNPNMNFDDLPSYTKFLGEFFVCFFFSEFYFYWGHRLAHTEYFYP